MATISSNTTVLSESYYQSLHTPSQIEKVVDQWFSAYDTTPTTALAILSSLICRSVGLYIDFNDQCPSPYEFIQTLNSVKSPEELPPYDEALPLLFAQEFFSQFFVKLFLSNAYHSYPILRLCSDWFTALVHITIRPIRRRAVTLTIIFSITLGQRYIIMKTTPNQSQLYSQNLQRYIDLVPYDVTLDSRELRKFFKENKKLHKSSKKSLSTSTTAKSSSKKSKRVTALDIMALNDSDFEIEQPAQDKKSDQKKQKKEKRRPSTREVTDASGSEISDVNFSDIELDEDINQNEIQVKQLAQKRKAPAPFDQQPHLHASAHSLSAPLQRPVPPQVPKHLQQPLPQQKQRQPHYSLLDDSDNDVFKGSAPQIHDFEKFDPLHSDLQPPTPQNTFHMGYDNGTLSQFDEFDLKSDLASTLESDRPTPAKTGDKRQKARQKPQKELLDDESDQSPTDTLGRTHSVLFTEQVNETLDILKSKKKNESKKGLSAYLSQTQTQISQQSAGIPAVPILGDKKVKGSRKLGQKISPQQEAQENGWKSSSLKGLGSQNMLDTSDDDEIAITKPIIFKPKQEKRTLVSTMGPTAGRKNLTNIVARKPISSIGVNITQEPLNTTGIDATTTITRRSSSRLKKDTQELPQVDNHVEIHDFSHSEEDKLGQSFGHSQTNDEKVTEYTTSSRVTRSSSRKSGSQLGPLPPPPVLPKIAPKSRKIQSQDLLDSDDVSDGDDIGHDVGDNDGEYDNNNQQSQKSTSLLSKSRATSRKAKEESSSEEEFYEFSQTESDDNDGDDDSGEYSDMISRKTSKKAKNGNLATLQMDTILPSKHQENHTVETVISQCLSHLYVTLLLRTRDSDAVIRAYITANITILYRFIIQLNIDGLSDNSPRSQLPVTRADENNVEDDKKTAKGKKTRRGTLISPYQDTREKKDDQTSGKITNINHVLSLLTLLQNLNSLLKIEPNEIVKACVVHSMNDLFQVVLQRIQYFALNPPSQNNGRSIGLNRNYNNIITQFSPEFSPALLTQLLMLKPQPFWYKYGVYDGFFSNNNITKDQWITPHTYFSSPISIPFGEQFSSPLLKLEILVRQNESPLFNDFHCFWIHHIIQRDTYQMLHINKVSNVTVMMNEMYYPVLGHMITPVHNELITYNSTSHQTNFVYPTLLPTPYSSNIRNQLFNNKQKYHKYHHFDQGEENQSNDDNSPDPSSDDDNNQDSNDIIQNNSLKTKPITVKHDEYYEQQFEYNTKRLHASIQRPTEHINSLTLCYIDVTQNDKLNTVQLLRQTNVLANVNSSLSLEIICESLSHFFFTPGLPTPETFPTQQNDDFVHDFNPLNLPEDGLDTPYQSQDTSEANHQNFGSQPSATSARSVSQTPIALRGMSHHRRDMLQMSTQQQSQKSPHPPHKSPLSKQPRAGSALNTPKHRPTQTMSQQSGSQRDQLFSDFDLTRVEDQSDGFTNASGFENINMHMLDEPAQPQSQPQSQPQPQAQIEDFSQYRSIFYENIRLLLLDKNNLHFTSTHLKALLLRLVSNYLVFILFALQFPHLPISYPILNLNDPSLSQLNHYLFHENSFIQNAAVHYSFHSYLVQKCHKLWAMRLNNDHLSDIDFNALLYDDYEGNIKYLYENSIYYHLSELLSNTSQVLPTITTIFHQSPLDTLNLGFLYNNHIVSDELNKNNNSPISSNKNGDDSINYNINNVQYSSILPAGSHILNQDNNHLTNDPLSDILLSPDDNVTNHKSFINLGNIYGDNGDFNLLSSSQEAEVQHPSLPSSNLLENDTSPHSSVNGTGGTQALLQKDSYDLNLQVLQQQINDPLFMSFTQLNQNETTLELTNNVKFIPYLYTSFANQQYKTILELDPKTYVVLMKHILKLFSPYCFTILNNIQVIISLLMNDLYYNNTIHNIYQIYDNFMDGKKVLPNPSTLPKNKKSANILLNDDSDNGDDSDILDPFADSAPKKASALKKTPSSLQGVQQVFVQQQNLINWFHDDAGSAGIIAPVSVKKSNNDIDNDDDEIKTANITKRITMKNKTSNILFDYDLLNVPQTDDPNQTLDETDLILFPTSQNMSILLFTSQMLSLFEIQQESLQYPIRFDIIPVFNTTHNFSSSLVNKHQVSKVINVAHFFEFFSTLVENNKNSTFRTILLNIALSHCPLTIPLTAYINTSGVLTAYHYQHLLLQVPTSVFLRLIYHSINILDSFTTLPLDFHSLLERSADNSFCNLELIYNNVVSYNNTIMGAVNPNYQNQQSLPYAFDIQLNTTGIFENTPPIQNEDGPQRTTHYSNILFNNNTNNINNQNNDNIYLFKYVNQTLASLLTPAINRKMMLLPSPMDVNNFMLRSSNNQIVTQTAIAESGWNNDVLLYNVQHYFDILNYIHDPPQKISPKQLALLKSSSHNSTFDELLNDGNYKELSYSLVSEIDDPSMYPDTSQKVERNKSARQGPNTRLSRRKSTTRASSMKGKKKIDGGDTSEDDRYQFSSTDDDKEDKKDVKKKDKVSIDGIDLSDISDIELTQQDAGKKGLRKTSKKNRKVVTTKAKELISSDSDMILSGSDLEENTMNEPSTSALKMYKFDHLNANAFLNSDDSDYGDGNDSKNPDKQNKMHPRNRKNTKAQVIQRMKDSETDTDSDNHVIASIKRRKTKKDAVDVTQKGMTSAQIKKMNAILHPTTADSESLQPISTLIYNDVFKSKAKSGQTQLLFVNKYNKLFYTQSLINISLYQPLNNTLVLYQGLINKFILNFSTLYPFLYNAIHPLLYQKVLQNFFKVDTLSTTTCKPNANGEPDTDSLAFTLQNSLLDEFIRNAISPLDEIYNNAHAISPENIVSKPKFFELLLNITNNTFILQPMLMYVQALKYLYNNHPINTYIGLYQSYFDSQKNHTQLGGISQFMVNRYNNVIYPVYLEQSRTFLNLVRGISDFSQFYYNSILSTPLKNNNIAINNFNNNLILFRLLFGDLCHLNNYLMTVLMKYHESQLIDWYNDVYDNMLYYFNDSSISTDSNLENKKTSPGIVALIHYYRHLDASNSPSPTSHILDESSTDDDSDEDAKAKAVSKKANQPHFNINLLLSIYHSIYDLLQNKYSILGHVKDYVNVLTTLSSLAHVLLINTQQQSLYLMKSIKNSILHHNPDYNTPTYVNNFNLILQSNDYLKLFILNNNTTVTTFSGHSDLTAQMNDADATTITTPSSTIISTIVLNSIFPFDLINNILTYLNDIVTYYNLNNHNITSIFVYLKEFLMLRIVKNKLKKLSASKKSDAVKRQAKVITTFLSLSTNPLNSTPNTTTFIDVFKSITFPTQHHIITKLIEILYTNIFKLYTKYNYLILPPSVHHNRSMSSAASIDRTTTDISSSVISDHFMNPFMPIINPYNINTSSTPSNGGTNIQTSVKQLSLYNELQLNFSLYNLFFLYTISSYKDLHTTPFSLIYRFYPPVTANVHDIIEDDADTDMYKKFALSVNTSLQTHPLLTITSPTSKSEPTIIYGTNGSTIVLLNKIVLNMYLYYMHFTYHNILLKYTTVVHPIMSSSVINLLMYYTYYNPVYLQKYTIQFVYNLILNSLSNYNNSNYTSSTKMPTAANSPQALYLKTIQNNSRVGNTIYTITSIQKVRKAKNAKKQSNLLIMTKCDNIGQYYLAQSIIKVSHLITNGVIQHCALQQQQLQVLEMKNKNKTAYKNLPKSFHKFFLRTINWDKITPPQRNLYVQQVIIRLGNILKLEPQFITFMVKNVR